MADAMQEDKSPLDIKLMGAGVLTACTLFIAGGLWKDLRLPGTGPDDPYHCNHQIFEPVA